MKIGKGLRPQACLTWWNKDCYLHTRKCKSLAASHFWYDWARDMILFSFDQKYESINEIKINFENKCGCGSLKHVFLDTLYQHFWSLFHSYLILSEKVLKKVCSFEIRIICSTVKPDIRPDIRLSGQPDIRYNPKISPRYHLSRSCSTVHDSWIQVL